CNGRYLPRKQRVRRPPAAGRPELARRHAPSPSPLPRSPAPSPPAAVADAPSRGWELSWLLCATLAPLPAPQPSREGEGALNSPLSRSVGRGEGGEGQPQIDSPGKKFTTAYP